MDTTVTLRSRRLVPSNCFLYFYLLRLLSLSRFSFCPLPAFSLFVCLFFHWETAPQCSSCVRDCSSTCFRSLSHRFSFSHSLFHSLSSFLPLSLLSLFLVTVPSRPRPPAHPLSFCGPNNEEHANEDRQSLFCLALLPVHCSLLSASPLTLLVASILFPLYFCCGHSRHATAAVLRMDDSWCCRAVPILPKPSVFSLPLPLPRPSHPRNPRGRPLSLRPVLSPHCLGSLCLLRCLVRVAPMHPCTVARCLLLFVVVVAALAVSV